LLFIVGYGLYFMHTPVMVVVVVMLIVSLMAMMMIADR